MSSADSPPGSRFFSLLVKGYLLGTLLSAIVLHVVIAIIAPGDAGTANALTSGVFVIVLFMVGMVGLVALPLAAAVSWPFRRLVFEDPILALFAASGIGVAAGAMLTATAFQIGPGDFWSGSLVGLVYGLVWFLVVRYSRRSGSADNA